MKFNYKSYLLEEQEDDLEEECKSNVDTFKKAGMDSLVERLEAKEESVIPFSALEKIQGRLLKAVFYHATSPKDFDKLLPIKVASVIALCNEKKYFKNLYIRSDLDVNNSLLSSYIVLGTDDEEADYLVAQWSAGPLESMDTIKEKAKPIIKSKIRSKIGENLKKSNSDLQNIDYIVEEYIAGNFIRYYL